MTVVTCPAGRWPAGGVVGGFGRAGFYDGAQGEIRGSAGGGTILVLGRRKARVKGGLLCYDGALSSRPGGWTIKPRALEAKGPGLYFEFQHRRATAHCLVKEIQ